MTSQTDPSDSDQSDLYAAYEVWKQWSEPFSYVQDDADYFAGEMRGIKIANGTLLELGFGKGGFLQWARDHGAHIAGTEINLVLLKAAKDREVELLAADFESVAERHRERFDAIVAFDVFEHFTIKALRVRLDAIEMMLRSGGHLVMRFPNAQSPFGLVPQHGDLTHRTGLSKSVFEQLLQGRNLKIVRYGPSFRTPGRRPIQRIVRFLRYCLRDLISAFLNLVYCSDIPSDAVVVLVVQKP